MHHILYSTVYMKIYIAGLLKDMQVSRKAGQVTAPPHIPLPRGESKAYKLKYFPVLIP